MLEEQYLSRMPRSRRTVVFVSKHVAREPPTHSSYKRCKLQWLISDRNVTPSQSKTRCDRCLQQPQNISLLEESEHVGVERQVKVTANKLRLDTVLLSCVSKISRYLPHHQQRILRQAYLTSYQFSIISLFRPEK